MIDSNPGDAAGFLDCGWECRSLSEAAPEKGHDAHAVTGPFAGVADGVTPLAAGMGSQIHDFALDALLLLAEHTASATTAADALEQAIVRLSGRPRQADSPSACVAWSRLTGDGHVEAAVLGDCTVAVHNAETDDVTVLTDQRVAPLEAAATNAYAELVRAGHEPSHALRAVQPLLADQRRKANRPGAHAYYVLGDDVAAAPEVRTMRGTLTPSMSILLATDGFTRAVDLGICASLPGLLRRLSEHPDELEHIGALIRERERADPHAIDYPRLSVHDDMTAVLLIRRAPADG